MLSKIKKILISKTTLIVFSAVLSIAMIGGAFVYKTVAATMCSNNMYCFGGKVQQIDICCNGLKIKIEGKEFGGTYMFSSMSKLYSWYNLSIGQCVLGDAYPIGICIKPFSWPPCTSVETVDGTIRQIGTTLSGPANGMCQNVKSSSA